MPSTHAPGRERNFTESHPKSGPALLSSDRHVTFLSSIMCFQLHGLPALLYVGLSGDFLGGLVAFVSTLKVEFKLELVARAKKGVKE